VVLALIVVWGRREVEVGDWICGRHVRWVFIRPEVKQDGRKLCDKSLVKVSLAGPYLMVLLGSWVRLQVGCRTCGELEGGRCANIEGTVYRGLRKCDLIYESRKRIVM
jgi:hypothetical protein